MDITHTVPWFVPGVLLSIALGVALRRPVARALVMPPALATALIASVGLIAAATLMPLRVALESDVAGSGRCDLFRFGLPSLEEAVRSGAHDIGPNVLLFIPLGLTVGLAPRSWQKVLLFVAAASTPPFIEVTQLLVPVLARGCESADVFDNWLGLGLGVTSAAVVERLRSQHH